MGAYWSLYLGAVAMQGLLGFRQWRGGVWLLFVVFLTMLIGLRHEVGCDWMSYLWYFERVEHSSFTEVWALSDPGYQFFNWLAARLGWDIHGANFLCAMVFASGLIVFCRRQPMPWLAMTVAVPYLVVVVAMGYTRQAVALGFIFWALVALEDRNLRKFLILGALATLFHKTAVLMIPLGLFLFGRGWFSRAVAVVLVGVGLWVAFLAEHQEALWQNYVEVAMLSQGATIRIVMNLVPALILLAFWRRWKTSFPQSRIWFWMALAAIACVPLLQLASTATDRIALYLTPLQVVVLSRLPVLAGRAGAQRFITAGVIVGYAAVLYVWLHYATHAYCWVPYDNLLAQ